MSNKTRFGSFLKQSEKQVLGHLAELEGGLSQASTVRRLVRQAALDRGLRPPRTPQLEQEVQTQQAGDALQGNSDTDA